MHCQVKPIPSIGRIVQYHAARSLTLPAVVYHVYQPAEPESPVDLVAFGDIGAMPTHRVPYGIEEPGRWSWPPFVPPAVVPDDEPESEDDDSPNSTPR